MTEAAAPVEQQADPRYDAFLSYSRADQAFARELEAALTRKNRRVWADWRDIPASAPWPSEIDEAIERAEAFVFVLSGPSLSSPHCRRELGHAVRNGKRIIPLLRRAVTEDTVPPKLAIPQWIRADGDEPI